jgi:hypothetical protein
MSEEKKIYELKDETMEQKLYLNKTVCKIIEAVYMRELFQSVVSLDKLIAELSAEEYLKVSEMIRDDLECYNSPLVLQLVRALKDTKYEKYIDYVILNLHYYLYLFRNEDYVVGTDIIEVLNSLCVGDANIRNALLQLVRKNLASKLTE